MKKMERTSKNRSPIRKSKNIRQAGASSIRWRGWRKEQRTLAVNRAKRHGGCEFCTNPSPNERLTWHHVFGRVHIIAEPWASFHALTLMLCFNHHRATHDQTLIRRAMEWMALDEFLSFIDYDTNLMKFNDLSPIAIIRTVVDDLNKRKILPPGFRSE